MPKTTRPIHIITALLISLLPAALSAEPKADLAIRNARIWTGDAALPWATALAVQGDSIVFVGTTEGVEAHIGTTTEVIDSPPGLVVPGFIDSHVHLLASGFELSSVQLRDASTPKEFAQRIAAFAAAIPEGTWITGGTWDHQNWGGQLPHRSWIDEATTATPVMVVRLDGHMVLANSLALSLAGIDADTPPVEGGEIVRDKDGRPTGVLKDKAMNLVMDIIPPPSPVQEDEALRHAMEYLAANGVTTVHDMGYDWNSVPVYRRAKARNELSVRLHANVPLSSWPELKAEIDGSGKGDNWLRLGGLKGFMDGSLGSHTAAFFEPFEDTPNDRGFFLQEPAQIQAWAVAADRAGLQLIIHAIGDRANAALLDIFDAVEKTNGPADRRARIEHAQHLRKSEIDRIAHSNVIPSMQPYHAIDDGRWAESVIGKARSRYTYAFKSLLDAGVPVAFGSDWSVAPASPVLGIYAAVTRQTLDGENPGGWVPEEKISVEQALSAYTRHGAYAGFEENLKGALATGRLADIVILDQDVTRIAPESIKTVQVVRTIVGGKTVFNREQPGAH